MDKFELMYLLDKKLKYYKCNFNHLYGVLEYYDSAEENIRYYKNGGEKSGARPLQSGYENYWFLNGLDIDERNKLIISFSIWYYIMYGADMSKLLTDEYYILLLAINVDDIIDCISGKGYSLLPERVYIIFSSNSDKNIELSYYKDIAEFNKKDVIKYITNLLAKNGLVFNRDYNLYYHRDSEYETESIYIDFIFKLDRKINIKDYKPS